MLTFWGDKVELLMHNRGCDIKSYSPLLLNVSPCKNKMVFWRKICCFWVQEFSRTHTFQVAFYDFWQESNFLTSLMVGKGQGLFFIFEKGQVTFLTSKKGQGAILTSKKRQGTFLTFKKRQGAFLTLKKGRVHFWLLKKGRARHPVKNAKHEHYSWFMIIVFALLYFLKCL